MTDGSQQPAIPIVMSGMGGGAAQGLVHVGPGGQHGAGGGGGGGGGAKDIGAAGGAQGLKQLGPG